MAKDKKTPKEGSELFHNIMKASVSGQQKPSYCFQLPNGTKVRVDPSNDSRVIFKVIPVAGKADSFTYEEESNTMQDHLVSGSFSLNDDNQLAVITYRQKKSKGELKPCE